MSPVPPVFHTVVTVKTAQHTMNYKYQNKQDRFQTMPLNTSLNPTLYYYNTTLI